MTIKLEDIITHKPTGERGKVLAIRLDGIHVETTSGLQTWNRTDCMSDTQS